MNTLELQSKQQIFNYMRLFIVIISLLLLVSCEKEEYSQIKKLIAESMYGDNSIITDIDTIGLPLIARKYFEFSGIKNKQRIRFTKFKSTGILKLTLDGKWLDGYAEEYLTIPNPSRNWIAEIKQSSLITAYAHETYIDRKGRNTVELFAPSQFQISQGKEFDVSGLVTYLDDLFLTPTALFSSNISWTNQSDSTAQITIKDYENEISAICYFDKSGAITKLYCSDRYRAVGNGAEKTDWTTTFNNYQSFDGIIIPTEIEYIWHLENEDFCYAKVHILEIVFDDFSMF